MNGRFRGATGFRGATPLLSLLLLASLPARACQVPVFRYALERWEPDAWRAVILHRGERDEGIRETVGYLEQAGTEANLERAVHRVDALTDDELWQLDSYAGDEPLPLLQLFSPLKEGRSVLVWQGPATLSEAQALLESPARSAVLEALITGVSAVWLLVEGSDLAATARAETLLRESLRAVEPRLSLPDGVVPAGRAGLAARDREEPLEMDDVLRSEIPLRIAFTVLRVPGEGAAERGLRTQLRALLPPGADPAAPFAVPVFGRGRMLEAVPAAALTTARVEAACRYLTGACSCQVKGENPGRDLLLRADWAGRVRGTFSVIERELPPLEGVADLLSRPATAPESPRAPAAEPGSASPGRFRLAMLALGGIVGAALLGVAVVSLLVVRGRSP